MPRRVLGITGIRSEYFLQRPIFRAIADHPDLELELIVTGAHLSTFHGGTAAAIEEDGFTIAARIESLLDSDRDAARLKGAAAQLQVLAHEVDRRRPDWLFATGDREDPLMLALCGAYMGLPVAHYSAGDRVVGNVDDMVRHAISRIAHLLLTTSEGSRERLIRAGEEEWRVHNVGHAGLDRFRTTPELDPRALAERLGVDGIRPPYLMVVQHPLSSRIEDAPGEMRETLAAVEALGLQAFVSYPNSDAGARGIIDVVEEARGRNPRLHVFRNIPDDAFVNLLRGAAALVGNSSMGVLEAPFLKLPAINVGARQAGREHGTNLFFVEPERGAIVERIRAVMEDDETRRRIAATANPFGDGRTGARVAALLADTRLDRELLDKDLAY